MKDCFAGECCSCVRRSCGCGICCVRCCGYTKGDTWHDKFTNTEYEKALYENWKKEEEEKLQALKEAQNYTQTAPRLKDGDVLGFIGHTMVDTVIQTVTGGDYGHAAIVCNSLWDVEKMGPKGESDVLIFESFSSHHGNFVLDALDHEIRSGTQCHVLHRRLDAMEDTVVCHPLKEPLTPDETEKLQNFLLKIHGEKGEYDYDQSYAIPFRKGRDKFETSHKDNLKRFFCSELVAAALQACGRLPQDLNVSTVVPADFALKDVGYFEGGGKDQSFTTPLKIGEDEAFIVVTAPHPPLAPIVCLHEKDREIAYLKQQLALSRTDTYDELIAENADLKKQLAAANALGGKADEDRQWLHAQSPGIPQNVEEQY